MELNINRKFVSAPVAIGFAMAVLWLLPHVGITPTEELQRLIVGGALAIAAMIIGGDIGYDWVGIIFGTQPLPDAPTLPDIFTDIIDKNEGNPPVTLPDKPQPFDPPITDTFEPVVDVFGERGNAHTDPVSGAIIESPKGYTHTYREGDSAHRAGKGGKVWNRKAVIVKPEYGMQVNIDSTAGKWVYDRDHQVTVDANQHYIVSLEYIGHVSPAAAAGYYNWIQANMYVNGQPLQPVGDVLINHSNLKNGRHVVSWVYTSDKTETVNLGYDLDVLWASAEGDSWIQFKSLAVQKKSVSMATLAAILYAPTCTTLSAPPLFSYTSTISSQQKSHLR